MMRSIVAAWMAFLSVTALGLRENYVPTVQQEQAATRLVKSLELYRHLDMSSLDRVEYRPARKYAFGDVTGDKIADLVVLLQLQEANNWIQYLAVLQGPDFARTYHARVGEKGWREIQLKDAARGAITVSTKYYRKKDSLCCPSVFGPATFTVVDGEIQERDSIIDCSRVESDDDRLKK